MIEPYADDLQRKNSYAENRLTALHNVYIVDIFTLYLNYVGFLMANESKNERFRRLAQSRGNRLIREISLLGNLANRKNYTYTAEEVDRLFKPIIEELNDVRALFDPDSPSNKKVTF